MSLLQAESASRLERERERKRRERCAARKADAVGGRTEEWMRDGWMDGQLITDSSDERTEREERQG